MDAALATTSCEQAACMLTENLVKKLQSPEVRHRIVARSDPKWHIDKSKKDTLHPSASFRKLNID